MSDQPGIPAINVFPPFNPAPRRDGPAPAPAAEPAPPAAESHAEPQAEPQPAPVWDAAPPAAPLPWDFEVPAAAEPPSAAPEAAGDAEVRGLGDEDEDLPWLEVPTPRPAGEGPGDELKAEDAPNFMEWARTEDLPPLAEAAPDDADDAEAPPISDFAADAQPWAPEVENAADDWAPPAPAEPWKAPEAEGDEAWKAPQGEDAGDPWRAPDPDVPPEEAWGASPSAAESAGEDAWLPSAAEPEAPAGDAWGTIEPQAEVPGADAREAAWTAPAEVDIPEPELYDLPDVPPAAGARPWIDAEAPLFEAPDAAAEPEPAWELPADSAAAPAADARPEWPSFTADDGAAAEEPVEAGWSAPEAQPDPEPVPHPAAARAGGPFADVADRLQAIADALRSDPGAFLAGAQGGGDALGLLVAGFVLGYQARQGGGS